MQVRSNPDPLGGGGPGLIPDIELNGTPTCAMSKCKGSNQQSHEGRWFGHSCGHVLIKTEHLSNRVIPVGSKQLHQAARRYFMGKVGREG